MVLAWRSAFADACGNRQVTKAMDGQEAYDEIVKKGGPDAFDVILMDLHMPRKVCSSPPCPSRLVLCCRTHNSFYCGVLLDCTCGAPVVR